MTVIAGIVKEKQDTIARIRSYPSVVRKSMVEIHIAALNKELLIK